MSVTKLPRAARRRGTQFDPGLPFAGRARRGGEIVSVDKFKGSFAASQTDAVAATALLMSFAKRARRRARCVRERWVKMVVSVDPAGERRHRNNAP